VCYNKNKNMIARKNAKKIKHCSLTSTFDFVSEDVVMFYKVVLTFQSVDKTLVGVTIQMKAIEHHYHVVLFSSPYRMIL